MNKICMYACQNIFTRFISTFIWAMAPIKIRFSYATVPDFLVSSAVFWLIFSCFFPFVRLKSMCLPWSKLPRELTFWRSDLWPTYHIHAITCHQRPDIAHCSLLCKYPWNNKYLSERFAKWRWQSTAISWETDDWQQRRTLTTNNRLDTWQN